MNLTQRLSEPETIISIVAFIFSLGGVWATLNNRIKELEMKMKLQNNCKKKVFEYI